MIRERVKIVVTLPPPEPDPPDQACAICGNLTPHWHLSSKSPAICQDCFWWHGNFHPEYGNFRDVVALAAARTVIHHMEAEIGQR